MSCVRPGCWRGLLNFCAALNAASCLTGACISAKNINQRVLCAGTLVLNLTVVHCRSPLPFGPVPSRTLSIPCAFGPENTWVTGGSLVGFAVSSVVTIQRSALVSLCSGSALERRNSVELSDPRFVL